MVKPEILQAVNSFKLRGVFNAVASLSPDERNNGISTVSAGNTAQALAWSARYFGTSARSIMPDTAPLPKIEAVKAYGGFPVPYITEEMFPFLNELIDDVLLVPERKVRAVGGSFHFKTFAKACKANWISSLVI